MPTGQIRLGRALLPGIQTRRWHRTAKDRQESDTHTEEQPLAPYCQGPTRIRYAYTVILLDWSGVDLTPQSTPYAEEAVELQDSNMALD